MTLTVQGVRLPNSKLAREITELVRDTESPLLFHHSSRVYCFGALPGKHRGLVFDPELLYAGAMFHDMGLTPKHSCNQERFEVDGANAACEVLRSHDITRAKSGGRGASARQFLRCDPKFGVAVVTRLRSPYIS